MRKSPFSLPNLMVVSLKATPKIWLKKNLGNQFYIIETKPHAAVRTARNMLLDFIIIDSDLGEHNVIELCREITKAIQPNITPILIITGRLRKSYRDKALKAGATDFLSDILDDVELHTRIAIGLKSLETQRKTDSISLALKQSQKLSESVVKNKFLLNDKALKAISKAQKEKIPLTILLIGIDSFSEKKKRYGTLAIDEALVLFSDFLAKTIRKSDILIPSSGGKFILILPNTKTPKAQELAEEIQDKISRKTFQTKKGEVLLSFSIALIKNPPKSQTAVSDLFEQIVQKATNSLKKVKNQIISLEKRRQK